MAVSPVLQIRKMRQHRSSHGISLGYLSSCSSSASCSGSPTASPIDNWALIVPNTIAAIVDGRTIAVARRYRRA